MNRRSFLQSLATLPFIGMSLPAIAQEAPRADTVSGGRSPFSPIPLTTAELALVNLVTKAKVPSMFLHFMPWPSLERVDLVRTLGCPNHKLAIMVRTDAYREVEDASDAEVAGLGWTTLRFTEDEIANQPQEILHQIHKIIEQPHTLSDYRGFKIEDGDWRVKYSLAGESW